MEGVSYTPYPANQFLTQRFQEILALQVRTSVLKIIHHLPETTQQAGTEKDGTINSASEDINRFLTAQYTGQNKEVVQVVIEGFLRPLSTMYEDCGEHEQAQTLNLYRNKLKRSTFVNAS